MVYGTGQIFSLRQGDPQSLQPSCYKCALKPCSRSVFVVITIKMASAGSICSILLHCFILVVKESRLMIVRGSAEEFGDEMGKVIVLHASHIGGRRYMI
jgi:hypothetical protein